MRKKHLLAMVFCLMLGNGALVQAKNPVLEINGQRADCELILKDDTIYVPIRKVSESMGASVAWNPETRVASIVQSESEQAVSDMLARVSRSTVAIVGNYRRNQQNAHVTTPAHGSGVVITSGGEILTNAHVVENLENIIVVMHDGSGYEASLKYIDTDLDLAVVKIQKLGLTPIKFADAEGITVGQSAYAVGTPISFSLRNSASRGIVSGVRCSAYGNYRLIQTDAAINPGNSGGPLVNSAGELIGINSSKFVSASIEGMGFAIPVDTVSYALRQFETYGKIRRVGIGITYEESWLASLGIPTPEGVTVKSVASGSSAERAGVQVGDVLMRIGTEEIHSRVDYHEAMKQYAAGAAIDVVFMRGSETLKLSLIAEE